MKKLFWALLLLLPAAASQAQYDSFGENKIVYDNFDWKTYRSTHFTIYFYDREKPAIQKVASYAESAYDDISRRLNFQIPKPINLIYYATHSDFEQTNTLLNFIPEGIGAFALPSRNRMVLPVDMADEKLQQLIAHELTHVFQFEILFGGNYLRAATTTAPQWFLEGMASYFGNDEDNRDRMVLRDAVLSDQVPEIAEKGIEGFFAYRFGHAVFDFIASEWGKDAVRDFLFEFRNQVGGKLDKVIKRTFNLSAEDFDIKFRRYLRQRYLKVLTEKGEPIDYGERFKIDDTPSAELSPRAYPSGDFVAAISTIKDDADVVLMSTRDRKLYRNLTKGYKTKYEYLVSQWLTTGPQSGADLAIAPDGNTVAVFGRRERGRDLLLLNALDGGIRERIEMPGLDQQLNPAFSPDGKTIVFRALKAGRSDLYAYHLDSRTITNLTDDDAYDFGPSFSPDGKWIYYSSVRGTRSKIFRFHPETPESREQITYGDWNDDDPVLSPDGRRLFFTSDRDAGINNIYSINLETGETFLHTNVFAGAFCPTVFVGKDNTEKLVFAAYYKRRFTLYIADARKPIQRLPDLAPSASPTGPQGYVPYQPAIEVAIDTEKVTSRPSRKLQLEDASINAGVNTDQTFVSNTVLVFGDNLGDRRFIAAVQSLSSYTNVFLQYVDLTKRLQKGIALFDDRQYYIGIDSSLGFDRAVRSRRIYRETGGLGTLAYPVSRYSRVEGNLGYVSRSIDYPISVDQTTGQIGFATLKNNFPIASVSFVNDTTLYKEWGALAGRKFRLGYSYQYDVDKGKYGDFTVSGNGPTLSQDITLEFRQYIKITERSLLAFRVFGVRADGNLPNIYYFGGLDTLRGLDFRTAYGNTVGYANFEYRFPLIDFLAFPIGGLRNIRGHVFFDIGGAALKDQPFRFWDSSNHQLINGIASYGYGLQVQLFGLQLHWDFARLTDLKKTLSGYRTAFFIGYEF
ncbi:MAG TPA: BamA/TamA family outer membrane protein [Thermoanaerobaculia bacterium]|jgi:Tol biopolymer transport system component|nr:BamA/TamA family outer membrane protein [Thermoanaerobaculia bacterium]